MEINRFKFSDKAVEKAIKVLKKELPDSKSPNFLKRFRNEITYKNGKLLYLEKEIVSAGNVDKTIRGLLYNKGSVQPWAKNSGYAALSKKYIGISRRKFRDVVNSQRIKAESDNVTRDEKKGT